MLKNPTKDGSGSIDRAELSVLLKTILGKTKLPSNGLQVDLEKGKLLEGVTSRVFDAACPSKAKGAHLTKEDLRKWIL